MRKLTTVSALIAIALSNVAVAKNNGEQELIKEQARELAENAKQSNTIRPETVLDNTDLPNIIRDGDKKDKIRSETEITKVKSKSESEKIDYFDNLKEARVKEFILNNVPPEILAAGDNEVSLYIRQHFIEKKDPTVEPEKEVIWSSDTTPLTPDSVFPTWDVSSQGENATGIVTEPAPSEPKDDEPAPNAIDTESALAALGMTQDELDAYLGNNVTDLEPDPAPLPETIATLQDIDIERVVLLGKRTYTNIDLTFMVKKGGQNRVVERRYDNAKVGFMFDIDGVPFELIEINKNFVVFQNLNEKTTHRGRVQ